MSIEKINKIGKKFRKNPEKDAVFQKFVVMKRLDDRLPNVGGYKAILPQDLKDKFTDVIKAVDKIEVWDAIEYNSKMSGSRFSPNNPNRMRQLKWGGF